MSESITRRKFLKLTGLGAAAVAVTGCGPAARYVVRRPYTEMPEYAQVGKSTYFATTCTECAAGCGLILRTFEGRAIKAEGNPNHPVNRGKLCSRGLTGVQGLYNPDRIKASGRRAARGDLALSPLEWDAAIDVVRAALRDPGGVAFYLGQAPDHLFDLASELCNAIGAQSPVRYTALASFDGRAAIREAAFRVFGKAALPYFDIANADLVLSFGANFLETWLSPVAYTRAYSQFRRPDSPFKSRGHLISFEARRSQTSGVADEWYPIRPGTEGLVANALLALLRDDRSTAVDEAAAQSGLSQEQLEHVAGLIQSASRPLFLPGGNAAGHTDGSAGLQAVLALNLTVGNLNQPGGVILPVGTLEPVAGTLADVHDLVKRMNSGQVKTLFIHGANPAFDLPISLGFKEALANVETVVSFASFPDETALLSDYVLPDHTPLESFGYQKLLENADRPVFASIQPVVVPLYDTRATADVLLAASDGKLPYRDEVDFLQQKLSELLDVPYGSVSAGEIATFWARYLQKGGWWITESAVPQATGEESGGIRQPRVEASPSGDGTSPPIDLQPVTPAVEGQFYLVTFPTQLGDGSGANRPWLQETPNPSTTVVWNTWLEVNPHTAEALGINDDDIVTVKSQFGEIEAVVYKFPAIRPDTVSIPFGQGHTALGRWAEGRGANPAALWGNAVNQAGDLAFGDTTVTITPTGRRRQLSRIESRDGIYGGH